MWLLVAGAPPGGAARGGQARGRPGKDVEEWQALDLCPSHLLADAPSSGDDEDGEDEAEDTGETRFPTRRAGGTGGAGGLLPTPPRHAPPSPGLGPPAHQAGQRLKPRGHLPSARWQGSPCGRAGGARPVLGVVRLRCEDPWAVSPSGGCCGARGLRDLGQWEETESR